MGEIIRICLVGLIVGILARYFYPGPIPMSLIGSILLGLAGSVVGGAVPRLVSRKRSREAYAPAGVIGSVLGAMLILFLARLIF